MNIVKSLLALTFLVALVPNANAQATAEAKQRITAKDVQVHPFCTVALGKKIDPKSKGVFDELRVVVTSDDQARIRITGKKKSETGTLEGRPVLHTGKVALVPFSERKGTIKVGDSTVDDVRGYFIVLELPKDTLKSKWLVLKEDIEYQWTISKQGEETIFTVMGEGKEVASIKAPAKDVEAFGIAAVVRWKGNETDISMVVE